MPDFETHPIGTGARLAELEALFQATQPSGVTEALDADVHRRLESVATTLETCGAHGIPIDFHNLAADIRAALAMRSSAADTRDKCCDPDNQMGMPESCPRCPQRADPTSGEV